MHKDNEYSIDGRLYIKRIKECLVRTVSGNTYNLMCRIHGRGEHIYFYELGSDHIVREGFGSPDTVSARKKFYLTESAAETVNAAVVAARAEVAAAKKAGSDYIKADFNKIKVALYYKTAGPFRYIPIYEDYGRQVVEYTFAGVCDLRGMLKGFAFEYRKASENKDLFLPNEGNLAIHPLYAAANCSGDKVTAGIMELCYGKASEESRKLISSLAGVDILPDAESDKRYYIAADEINAKVLEYSGYVFCHRPNFAMYGNTRTAFTVEPRQKTVIDCAPLNAECVPWQTFTDELQKI